MSRPVAVALVLLIAALMAPVGPGTAQPADAGVFAAAAQVDADAVVLRIDLREGGDANWTIEYRVRLADENDTAAFDSLQTEIRANRSAYTTQFADRMNRTVDRAADATGRPMAVSDVRVTATRRQLPQEYGVLSYTFTWAGFASAGNGEIRAGDAVAGLFLDEETTLLVSWPAGYGLVEARPDTYESRDDTLVWEGPLNFATGEPSIVVREGAAGGSTVASPTPGDGTPMNPETPPSDRGGVPWSWLAPILVLLVLAGGGAVYYLRTRSGDDGSDRDGDAGTAAREDLLSNEERVLRLMEERGGRMKQQEVASALDWTDAKTSQVVGDLRDAGDLEGFRLGRENVLTLPEEDQPVTGPDVDDETGDDAP